MQPNITDLFYFIVENWKALRLVTLNILWRFAYFMYLAHIYLHLNAKLTSTPFKIKHSIFETEQDKHVCWENSSNHAN